MNQRMKQIKPMKNEKKEKLKHRRITRGRMKSNQEK